MEINLRWYTRRNGQKEGSFSDRELAALIRKKFYVRMMKFGRCRCKTG